MFAINQHFFASGFRSDDGLLDGVEVFVIGAAQRHPHVIIPGLGHKADGGGFRVKQILQASVVGNGAPCPLHHAKGREHRFGFSGLGEESGIRGVGTGIAALDVVHAQAIQQVDHRQLVIQRKINPRRLLPIAQRGIKKRDVFTGHGLLSFSASRMANSVPSRA